MRNKVIALMLSVAMAAGSIGTAPVLAAETTAEEAAAVEEESTEPEEINEIEDADIGMTSEEAPEEEPSVTDEEESVQEVTVQEEPAEDNDVPSEEDTAPEEGTLENFGIGVTSTEITEIEAEIEEPEEIEEEIIVAEDNEAMSATSGKCGANATWSLSGSTLTITGKGAMYDYITVETDTGGRYFDYFPNTPWSSNWSIKEVVIKEGITYIGNYAFASGVNGSGLETITIPNSVKSIGVDAFSGCNVLKRINISSLESWLNMKDQNNSLSCLETDLYVDGKPLVNVDILSGVSSIRDYAFYGCKSIKSITIPSGIKKIGNSAFSGCRGLTSVTIPSSVTSIGDNAFYGAVNIKNITIPTGVTSIGDKAFCNCSHLTSIAIPKSVTSIGDYALYNCSSLTSLEIPNSVTSIGDYAFGNCRGLTSVTIPSSVTSIGEFAFSGANNIKSITILSGKASIGQKAFRQCSSLTSITIPQGVSSIGKSAFEGCDGLKRINVSDLKSWLKIKDQGNSLSRLGCNIYVNGELLVNVVIPSGISEIRDYAFYKWKSIKSVTIPSGVKNIGNYAFYHCENIEKAEIPSSVTSIGGNTFCGCKNIKSIVIPSGVTSIKDGAFSACPNINIAIPTSVKEIGYTSIPHNADIYYCGSEEQWDAIKGSNLVEYNSITFALISNTFSVDADFHLEKPAYNFTGDPIKPGVTVTYEGKKLVEGNDYELTYENNTNIGTAAISVTGLGSYAGTAKLQYRIRLGNPPKVTCTNVATGMKVSWEKVSGATRYKVYRDDQLIFTTSALVVTDKDVKYKGGQKFVYKVVATEKNTGDSDLFKTSTYYRLMPVGIKSLTNPSAGKMTVNYDYSKGGSGYVVRYGLKSDMSDAKVVTVKGENTTSRTFGGMKKGKTYYVQVRTYKIENGVRYYSGYCTTKKITINK